MAQPGRQVSANRAAHGGLHERWEASTTDGELKGEYGVDE